MHLVLGILRDLALMAVFLTLAYQAMSLWERGEHLAAFVFLLDGLAIFPGVPMALTFWG